MSQFPPFSAPSELPAGADDGKPDTPNLPRGQARALQALHADYARRLEAVLRPALGQPIAQVTTLRATTGQTLCDQAAQYPHLFGFAAGHPDAGLIACSAELARLLVDRLLGYQGALVREERPLSDIEVQMLRGALEPLLAAYADAWTTYATFQPRLLPGAALPGPTVPCYLAIYRVQTAQGAGNIALALRLSAWEDVLAGITRQEAADDAPNLGLLDAIGESTLPVRVLLGGTRITVAELLGLREGDIICLEQPADTPLPIHIGNTPKLLGRARVENARLVVTVEGAIPRGRS